jgi:uncharacterized protein DUF6313
MEGATRDPGSFGSRVLDAVAGDWDVRAAPEPNRAGSFSARLLDAVAGDWEIPPYADAYRERLPVNRLRRRDRPAAAKWAILGLLAVVSVFLTTQVEFDLTRTMLATGFSCVGLAVAFMYARYAIEATPFDVATVNSRLMETLRSVLESSENNLTEKQRLVIYNEVASSTGQDIDVVDEEAAPKPDDRPRDRHRVRSWWETAGRVRRSAAASSNFIHFLFTVALPLTAAYIALYVLNGVQNGWRVAFEVSLAVASPADGDVRHPWLALPLSVAGWLIGPVLAGGIVSFAVSTMADGSSRRTRRQARPRRFERIPRLRDRVATDRFEIPNAFVEDFVSIHDGDWRAAQDHFEREVVFVLRSDAVGPGDPQAVAMRAAVSAAVSILQLSGSTEQGSGADGICPLCPGPRQPKTSPLDGA